MTYELNTDDTAIALAPTSQKTCGCGPDCACGDDCTCGSEGTCAPAEIPIRVF